jgi:hypothetical protein
VHGGARGSEAAAAWATGSEARTVACGEHSLAHWLSHSAVRGLAGMLRCGGAAPLARTSSPTVLDTARTCPPPPPFSLESAADCVPIRPGAGGPAPGRCRRAAPGRRRRAHHAPLVE